jgi:hypothetical protein
MHPVYPPPTPFRYTTNALKACQADMRLPTLDDDILQVIWNCAITPSLERSIYVCDIFEPYLRAQLSNHSAYSWIYYSVIVRLASVPQSNLFSNYFMHKDLYNLATLQREYTDIFNKFKNDLENLAANRTVEFSEIPCISIQHQWGMQINEKLDTHLQLLKQLQHERVAHMATPSQAARVAENEFKCRRDKWANIPAQYHIDIEFAPKQQPVSLRHRIISAFSCRL